MKLNMPDVTKAQLLAALGWVVSQLIAWGYMGDSTGQLVLGIGSTAVAVGWKLADAHIRHGRALGPGAVAAGEAAPGTAPAAAPHQNL